MRLLNTKSVLKQEITPEEIKALITTFPLKDPGIVHAHLDGIAHFEEDTIVCEGDLIIEGNFDMYESGICNLIVTGDLIVNGTLEHFDDPSTLILVGNNLKVENLITAGTLIVCGNVEIKNALIGDYNDYSATIYGNVQAAFFYPEEHFFEIQGEIRFDRAYGNTWRVNNKENNIQFMSNFEAYKVLQEDLLSECQPVEIINELSEKDIFFERINTQNLYKRLRAKQSIFKN